jgi:hypothetical protein
MLSLVDVCPLCIICIWYVKVFLNAARKNYNIDNSFYTLFFTRSFFSLIQFNSQNVQLLVRGAFEIFDCETIGIRMIDGRNESVSALSTDGSIICGTSEHNALVVPAMIAMVVYGVGIPLFFAVVLYRHFNLIRIDQELRQRGEGYSVGTNPGYYIRQKYQRIYQHFKSERAYWGMVILCRKFLLAACTLLLRENPRFQVTVALVSVV